VRWALNLPGPTSPKLVMSALGTAAKRYLALNYPAVDESSEATQAALEAQMTRAIAAAGALATDAGSDVLVTVSGDLAPGATKSLPGAAVTVTVQVIA
jgi:hypothetical protein